MKPTVGSLFAGIGGIDLGFERAGFETVWQVEQNEFCRKVLAKNFPHADRSVTDVRDAGSRNLKHVDVIVGGFPCQDISNAGPREGITGKRSGLWKEYARIIGELRPCYVLVENVAALLRRGLDVVLGDLAEIGYNAEWQVISAANVGAPHRRERVWIVAYPNGGNVQRFVPWVYDQKIWQEQTERQAGFRGGAGEFDQWAVEPSVGRVAHGVPRRMDRLKSLGNAVVPQIPELIAKQIIQKMDRGNK
jgi:DNA (cytosine-5)-methyltransferase 1